MILISKDEKKELRKHFPEQYFHRTRHHVYMECRPAITKALHALRTVACMVLIALVLTACGRRVIYHDNALTVSRQGRNTTITTAEGKEYHYTTVRVKRQPDAVMKTLTDTDDMKVLTAHNIILIVEKSPEKYVTIRSRG